MITLYPPLESRETHRLQHVAEVEVRFRLEKERDFRASMYKKYRRGANVADGIDTALSVTSVGLAASGVGLLSTIIAAPAAIGLPAGAIVCGLLGAGGKFVGRRPENMFDPWPGRVKAKHNRRPHFSCPERRQNYRRGISSDPL